MPELYPFQTQGVARVVAQGGGGYLNWEPGLGKTAAAVRTCDRMGARDIVAVVPAHGKHNWAREVRHWQTMEREVFVVDGMKTTPPDTNVPKVIVINWDLLSRPSAARDWLLRHDYDALLIDEAHMAKGDSTRARVLYGDSFTRPRTSLAGRAAFALALSGTPVPNYVHELYPVLRALAPHTLKRPSGAVMSYDDFLTTFCATTYDPRARGLRVVGSKRLDDLRARVTGFMDTLKTKDVLPELPELRFATYPITPFDLETSNPALAAEVRHADKGLSAVLARCASDAEVLDALHHADIELATERRLIGYAKAPLVAQCVMDELDGAPATHKVIVFAQHRAVIDELLARLARFLPVRIDGRDSSVAKTQAQDAFQNVLAHRVAVCQLDAANTNLTLTAARSVHFAEASWTPTTNFQAAKRAHRIGQKNPVVARMYSILGTFDDRIQAVLARKAAEQAELFA